MITIDDLIVSGIDGNGNEFFIYFPFKEYPNISIYVSNDHIKQTWVIGKRISIVGKINNDFVIKKGAGDVLYPSEFLKFLNSNDINAFFKKNDFWQAKRYLDFMHDAVSAYEKKVIK